MSPACVTFGSLLFCIFAFDYTCARHSYVSLHLCVFDGHSCVLRLITRVCMEAPSNYRSLLQNIVSFIGLFCKRDLSF